MIFDKPRERGRACPQYGSSKNTGCIRYLCTRIRSIRGAARESLSSSNRSHQIRQTRNGTRYPPAPVVTRWKINKTQLYYILFEPIGSASFSFSMPFRISSNNRNFRKRIHIASSTLGRVYTLIYYYRRRHRESTHMNYKNNVSVDYWFCTKFQYP